MALNLHNKLSNEFRSLKQVLQILGIWVISKQAENRIFAKKAACFSPGIDNSCNSELNHINLKYKKRKEFELSIFWKFSLDEGCQIFCNLFLFNLFLKMAIWLGIRNIHLSLLSSKLKKSCESDTLTSICNTFRFVSECS